MLELTPVMQKYVLHWGEMGTRWGINRTVAQIHALLYIWPEPLDAEQIAATLSVARSNVSTSLRELQGWGLVRVVHKLGDRRDHFDTLEDVWEMFRVIVAERKNREIDPTLTLLRDCVLEGNTEQDGMTDYTKERMAGMLEFFETTSDFYDRLEKFKTPTLLKFAKMGDRVVKMLTVGSDSE